MTHVLGKKVLRIGLVSIYLPFVMRLDKWPALEGAAWEEDERRPRLNVRFSTGASLLVTEAEAISAGFAGGIAELEGIVIQALDALD